MRTVIRFAFIAAAGWCAEETCILAYNFYSYSAAWRLFLIDVPLLIVLVWPAVIQSAWDLSLPLARLQVKRVPFIAAGIVGMDACLIEPVAVHAGLWHWTKPGIYDVPLIGLFGWACFAYLCIRVLCFQKRGVAAGAVTGGLMVLAVFGLHLVLLCTYWGVFKWMEAPLNPIFIAAAAWGISIGLSCVIVRSDLAFRIEEKTLLIRIPAALFIFGLLAVSADTDMVLPIYAVAFAVPYLTVMMKQYRPLKGTPVKPK